MWETLSSTLVTVACTPFGVAALVFYVPYTFGSRTTCEEIGGRQGIESNRGKGNRRYRQGRLGEGSISGVQTHTHSMEKKREGEQAREGSRRPTALLPGREMDRASARRIDAKSRRTRSSPKGSLLSPPLVPAAYPLLLSLSLCCLLSLFYSPLSLLSVFLSVPCSLLPLLLLLLLLLLVLLLLPSFSPCSPNTRHFLSRHFEVDGLTGEACYSSCLLY